MQLFLAGSSDSWRESERQPLSGAFVQQATFRRSSVWWKQELERQRERERQVGSRPEAWLEVIGRRAGGEADKCLFRRGLGTLQLRLLRD